MLLEMPLRGGSEDGSENRGKEQIGVAVEAVEAERLRVSSWSGEAVLLGQYWLESGLVGYLEEAVRGSRGRMGQYEVTDSLLLLNSYAVSGERTLGDYFKSIAPVKEVMMGLWRRPLAGISKRARCLSASSMSRFLAAVGSTSVGGLRELFERDMGRNGVRVMQGVGMFDRAEDHSMVIDVDGTVSAARQRSLVKDQLNYPRVQRRSDKACAPGYKGRKRGEVSRTRSPIAVAQTSKWLGSYGGSGNGDAKGELEQACE